MQSAKILRTGGVVIAVAAMFFVVRSVYGYADQLYEMLQIPQFIPVVLAGAIFYALVLQLVGLAWFTLLASVGEKAIAPFLALRIFARTQVYKYLPTNVVHLVGRFVVASRLGASKEALSYAQMMEIVLMVLAAGSVALLFSFSFVLQAGEDYGINRYLASAAYLVGGLAAFVLAPIVAGRYFKQSRRHVTFSMAALSIASYVLFFLANGLIVIVLVHVLYGPTMEWKMVIGVSAAGWLLGFVVPGAPGGLGVREAVFIAGLTTIGIPAATSTAVAIAHRVVTLLGDVLLSGLELGYRKWMAEPE
ncbi:MULTISPECIES: YbhN family protein [unclassified Mesorhizobium]|uniref:lysylphosphatidylglycerol synthase transmembrane domain-containing protein n=1 Tax=unclassified Mesorhizobium TaxID=325217 RepID=UPI0003CDFD45|nr:MULTISPECIES: YbhN family protein [unclassified Mesorhizobium]ESY15631.1 hypothetical protein X751_24040 [Mesorhizobium sp. LNJC395A00]ESY43325.1 hypothetical protein X746_22685 [Mesorhizobium sp. LNJC380A00]WJI75529.1 YbhN family protein [Mesorhizobium sp. C395A]